MRWWMASGIVVLVSLAADVVFHDPSHSYFWWHDVPGFDFVLGVVGCAAIIVVAKGLGALGLQLPDADAGDEGDA